MSAIPSLITSENSNSGNARFLQEQIQIGKYQVLAELGRGGAASVSLAVATGKAEVRKLVVLKALLPELAEEPEAVTAFLDEAKLAAQLNHPNVVQTFEVGTESGRHVIVMEYLDGQSLSRIVRNASRGDNSVPLAIHLRILIEVLEGLHYAHEMKAYDGRPMQLVHRDVSPQNVIVTYDGQVKILDFGIAKAATTSTHTAAGIMKGKIAYMAPEQMAATLVDRRADIYSAGCMLWAAAANQKLWHEVPDVQIVRSVVAGKIPSPKSVNPNCPDELERIVMRALHPDPDRRYATAREMQSDLEHFADSLGKPVKARDIGHFVSDLFKDCRAELNENIEQELAQVLARDKSAQNRATVVEPIRMPGVDGTAKSGVQNARSRSGTRLALGAIGLIGIAIGSLVLWNNNRVRAAAASTTSEASTGLSPGLAAASAAAAEQPAQPAQQASIKLEIVPPSAQVTLDGQRLAAGTTELKLPIGDADHELVAEAEGFQRQSQQFKVKSSTLLALQLAPVPAAEARKGPAKPRAQVAPARAPVRPAAVPAAAPAEAPKPTVSTQAACDNPFYLDADGIKRVRPNCRQ